MCRFLWRKRTVLDNKASVNARARLLMFYCVNESLGDLVDLVGSGRELGSGGLRLCSDGADVAGPR